MFSDSFVKESQIFSEKISWFLIKRSLKQILKKSVIFGENVLWKKFKKKNRDSFSEGIKKGKIRKSLKKS